MSRMSTLSSFRSAYKNVSDNYYKTNKLGSLIGSENKFSSFNDLYQGSDIRFVVDLAKTNEDADTYIHNINMTRLKLTTIKDVVEDILNIAEDIKNQLIMYQLITAHLSKEDLQSMTKSYLNDLKSTLNYKLGGYYLLSGSKFETPPIQEDILNPDLQTLSYDYYQGDNFSSLVKLNENLEISYNVTANNPAFAKLISALNIVYYNADSLRSITEAEALLADAISGILSIRYNLMNSAALLDKYEVHWQEIKEDVSDNYGSLEEEYHLSFPELFANIAATEVVLEASQSMFTKIASTNLLDSL